MKDKLTNLLDKFFSEGQESSRNSDQQWADDHPNKGACLRKFNVRLKSVEGSNSDDIIIHNYNTCDESYWEECYQAGGAFYMGKPCTSKNIPYDRCQFSPIEPFENFGQLSEQNAANQAAAKFYRGACGGQFNPRVETIEGKLDLVNNNESSFNGSYPL